MAERRKISCSARLASSVCTETEEAENFESGCRERTSATVKNAKTSTTDRPKTTTMTTKLKSCQCQTSRRCVRCKCVQKGSRRVDCYPSRNSPSTCSNVRSPSAGSATQPAGKAFSEESLPSLSSSQQLIARISAAEVRRKTEPAMTRLCSTQPPHPSTQTLARLAKEPEQHGIELRTEVRTELRAEVRTDVSPVNRHCGRPLRPR